MDIRCTNNNKHNWNPHNVDASLKLSESSFGHPQHPRHFKTVKNNGCLIGQKLRLEYLHILFMGLGQHHIQCARKWESKQYIIVPNQTQGIQCNYSPTRSASNLDGYWYRYHVFLLLGTHQCRWQGIDATQKMHSMDNKISWLSMIMYCHKCNKHVNRQ